MFASSPLFSKTRTLLIGSASFGQYTSSSTPTCMLFLFSGSRCESDEAVALRVCIPVHQAHQKIQLNHHHHATTHPPHKAGSLLSSPGEFAKHADAFQSTALKFLCSEKEQGRMLGSVLHSPVFSGCV